MERRKTATRRGARRIRVCVAGVTGWTGRPLVERILAARDMTLVGAVARSTAGKSLRDVFGPDAPDITVSGSVRAALAEPADVYVDYTRADAVRANVLTAVRRGVHVVIGSSGLTDRDFDVIGRAASARGVGVVAVANFAPAAVLMQRLTCEAARVMPSWELIDYATDAKVDAPSGMTRELAARLAAIRHPAQHEPAETIGSREARGLWLCGTPIHSVRLPGYVVALEARFGDTDQRLTIRYEAGSGAEPYLEGTLRAIREAPKHVGLVRGWDRLTAER